MRSRHGITTHAFIEVVRAVTGETVMTALIPMDGAFTLQQMPQPAANKTDNYVVFVYGLTESEFEEANMGEVGFANYVHSRRDAEVGDGTDSDDDADSVPSRGESYSVTKD